MFFFGLCGVVCSKLVIILKIGCYMEIIGLYLFYIGVLVGNDIVFNVVLEWVGIVWVDLMIDLFLVVCVFFIYCSVCGDCFVVILLGLGLVLMVCDKVLDLDLLLVKLDKINEVKLVLFILISLSENLVYSS